MEINVCEFVFIYVEHSDQSVKIFICKKMKTEKDCPRRLEELWAE